MVAPIQCGQPRRDIGVYLVCHAFLAAGTVLDIERLINGHQLNRGSKPLNLSQGKVSPLFERSISQMIHPLENDFPTYPLKKSPHRMHLLRRAVDV